MKLLIPLVVLVFGGCASTKPRCEYIGKIAVGMDSDPYYADVGWISTMKLMACDDGTLRWQEAARRMK